KVAVSLSSPVPKKADSFTYVQGTESGGHKKQKDVPSYRKEDMGSRVGLSQQSQQRNLFLLGSYPTVAM
ncbi:MAG: hypothetical protein ABIL06_25015, partial [Pseudomonadota bacterium]